MKIKGLHDFVQITEEQFYVIKQIHGDPNEPSNTVIDLPNMSIKKGDIVFVQVEEKPKDEKSWEKAMKEYQEQRASFLARPIEEKTDKLFHWFSIFHFVIRGNHDGEEEKFEKAKLIMKEFYEKNPFRQFPDMFFFKEIIGEVINVDSSQMKSFMREGGLRLLMRCEDRDKIDAEQDELLAKATA